MNTEDGMALVAGQLVEEMPVLGLYPYRAKYGAVRPKQEIYTLHDFLVRIARGPQAKSRPHLIFQHEHGAAHGRLVLLLKQPSPRHDALAVHSTCALLAGSLQRTDGLLAVRLLGLEAWSCVWRHGDARAGDVLQACDRIECCRGDVGKDEFKRMACQSCACGVR